jgi:hypothetical protein
VNAHGRISLAGFSYAVGATYAGEPVEVVMSGGLVDILHAGAVVATHGQWLREDQADRKPRARAARRARDATAGLTVTRLADGARVVSFAGTSYACGRRWAREPVDVTIVAGRCSCPATARAFASTPSATTASASSARSATRRDDPSARTPPLATSPYDHVAQVPELDTCRIVGQATVRTGVDRQSDRLI